jgi:hypothetical protein
MPTLLGMGKRCFSSPAEWVPSLEKGKDDVASISKAAAAVCVSASSALAYNRQAFPWQEVKHPLLAKKTKDSDGSTLITAPIRGKLVELLSHHIIFGEIVVPGATYLEMTIAAATFRLGMAGKKWKIETVSFANPLTFRLGPEKDRPAKDLSLEWRLSPDGSFTVSSNGNAHAEGVLKLEDAVPALQETVDLSAVRARCVSSYDIERLYVPFAGIGLPLQPRFRSVRQIWLSEDNTELIARIEAEDDGTNGGMLFNPAVIDGTFQASMVFLQIETTKSLRIPLRIQNMILHSQGFSTKIWCYHRLIEITSLEISIQSKVLDDNGTVLMEWESATFREVRPEHIRKMLQSTADDFDKGLLDVEWVDLKAGEPAAPAAYSFVTPDAALKSALKAKMPATTCAASVAEATAGPRVLLALEPLPLREGELRLFGLTMLLLELPLILLVLLPPLLEPPVHFVLQRVIDAVFFKVLLVDLAKHFVGALDHLAP